MLLPIRTTPIAEGVYAVADRESAAAVRRSGGRIALRESEIAGFGTVNAPLVRGVVRFFSRVAFFLGALTRFSTMNPRPFTWRTSGGAVKRESAFAHILYAAAEAVLILLTQIVIPAALLALLVGQGGVGYRSAAVASGLLRAALFPLLIGLSCCLRPLRRLAMYHGAAQRAVCCARAGLEPTPKNMKRCPELSGECDGGFVLLVIFLTLAATAFLPADGATFPLTALARMLILLLVAALVNEPMAVTRNRRGSWAAQALRFPSKLFERLITLEPNDQMMEVAQAALSTAMARYEESEARRRRQSRPRRSGRGSERNNDHRRMASAR